MSRESNFILNSNEYEQSNKENSNSPFIKKIQNTYITLSFQVFFSLIASFNSLMNEKFSLFQLKNTWLAILLGCLSFLLPWCMYFSIKYLKLPFRYVFLSIHTLSLSYTISYLCALTNPKYGLMIVFMCFCLLFGLSVYVAITKSVLTLTEGMVFISLISLLLLIIFAIFTDNKMGYVLITTLFIVLLGAYVIYDTLLMGLNSEIQNDDFIEGTFCIYTDYLIIFSSLFEIMKMLANNKDI